MVRFLRGVVILLAALPGAAQPRFEYWPGISYDPKIPTVRQVLGYETGDRVSSHAAILKYMEALAAAAPSRMKIFDYGQTWEGRRLVYAAVGSETTIGSLSEIRAAVERLADPRKTPAAEAKRIMSGLPAIVWLSYGVHGNEISSPDAALLTAYHLLAARGDKMVDEILAHVLVLIDPSQNPDGRDRFVNYFEETRGLEPDPSPIAAEHEEPWPGGRTNHYLFDLNRDWIALTQPEIRNQVKVLREWFPLVCVDLHEMSGESTYFFSPESDPYNPNLTADQKETLKLFGKNNARWFDQFGFDYFTRENYDAFYPGYGASWPSYYGGIAMTYEQASARGLVLRRSDDTLLTFRDTVRHHFVASLSTLEAAAAHREKLLDDFYRYGVTAIEEGRTEPVKEYILPRSGDASATDKLAGILVEHGIEVEARHGALPQRRPRVPRRNLRGADGAARQAAHTDPARSPHPHGRAVRGGRRGAAQTTAAQRNLRRHRLVPAADVQRGGGPRHQRFAGRFFGRKAGAGAAGRAARRQSLGGLSGCPGAPRRPDGCWQRRCART